MNTIYFDADHSDAEQPRTAEVTEVSVRPLLKPL